MRPYRPSLKYQLMIPDATQKREDPGIVSFWQDDCDIVLQLSSLHRFADEQVSADQRLNEAVMRMDMTNVVRERIEIDACPDVAAATMIDPEKVDLDLLLCSLAGPRSLRHDRRRDEYLLRAQRLGCRGYLFH